MKRDDHPYLLFIEPRRPASPEPVIDELTMKMTAALRQGEPGFNTHRGFVQGRFCGVHECDCGATSESHDYKLPGGLVTNSLCVHYLAHHRDEVPQIELDKVATLACGLATPSAEDLQAPAWSLRMCARAAKPWSECASVVPKDRAHEPDAGCSSALLLVHDRTGRTFVWLKSNF